MANIEKRIDNTHSESVFSSSSLTGLLIVRRKFLAVRLHLKPREYLDLIGSLNSARLAYLFRCLPEFRWKANSLTSYSLAISQSNFLVELPLKQWGVALLFLPRWSCC